MASGHAHVPAHVSVQQEIPPSPTLTNPDMILPFEQHEPVVLPSPQPTARTLTTSSKKPSRKDDDNHAEVGIATAVALPVLARGQASTSLSVSSFTSAAKPAYHGYEHGAPLSDIGEEAEEITIRSRGSSPERSKSPSSKHAPPLRHKKRLSNLSSSSGGSDKKDQWDEFDTTRLMSDRVAADIAQARDAVEENEENEESQNKHNSRDLEEELVALDERAEKILANARKRLSHMEDNLTKARHSILLSPRSIPNMHELGHQPGGLYRSISQSAQNRRSKGLFPASKSSQALQHSRTGSEVSPVSGLKRLSNIPEPRSASAMDFSPARYGVGFITSELKPSPPSTTKMPMHSPSSSRSYNSPLRILAEERDNESPSTVKTSPDSASTSANSFHRAKGLGIHSTGTKAQEDLSQIPLDGCSSDSPASMIRSSSQASTRSARELKDQISEMKNRIADLKNKAQADTLRRRSMQSLRTPSPFLNANINGHGAEGWYSGAGPSNYQQQSTTPTSPYGGPGWRPTSGHGHERRDSALESLADPPPAPIHLELEAEDEGVGLPVTPVAPRRLNVNNLTPIHPSSARTDRNTPNLANRMVDTYDPIQQHEQVAQMDGPAEEEEQDFEISEDDDEPIASNEEEQIYLNEVLEESLHDIEPEIPPIPGEYLVGDELIEISGEEAERHEDRLDAFDYENMFLHSAMGTYRGDGDSDDTDDDESLVTSREDVKTPVAGYSYGHQDQFEDEDDRDTISGEEPEDEMLRSDLQPRRGLPPTSPSTSQGTPSPVQQRAWSQISSPVQARSPARISPNSNKLRAPVRPWMASSRSRSMETVSSIASYQTAMEDEGDEQEEDDANHEEVLNWGNVPAEHDTNGQRYHSHGMSAKAQNVLGWPASSNTEKSPRIQSFSRPYPSTHSNGHQRTASGSSLKGSPGPSPLSSVQYSYPFPSSVPVQPPPNQPLPPPPQFQETYAQPVTAATHHQANTEILMESLIKLADPEFSIGSTGRSKFAEVDKELVLGLLRAVGGVCDNVLRAQHGRRSSTVKELRSRLADAKQVLTGFQSGPEGLEEILEDDEEQRWD